MGAEVPTDVLGVVVIPEAAYIQSHRPFPRVAWKSFPIGPARPDGGDV